MWKTRLISDGGLSVSTEGFDLDVRLPWYRSLPLSTLRGVSLRMDGREIPAADIQLGVNGRRFALDALEDEVEEWWHILDSGVLHVRHGPLAPGSVHAVDMTLSLEIPYVAGAVITTNCVKSLKAA